MKTISDFINANDGDLNVVIAGINPDNRSDPFSPRYYEGPLRNIPEQLRDLEVLETGWLIGAQMHCLEIARPEDARSRNCPVYKSSMEEQWTELATIDTPNEDEECDMEM